MSQVEWVRPNESKGCEGAQFMQAIEDVGANTTSEFDVNPDVDELELCDVFKKSRRVRICNVLRQSSALALHKYLANQVLWRPFITARGRVFTAPPHLKTGSSRELEAKLLERAYEGAAHGFTSLHYADRLFPEEVPAASRDGVLTGGAALHDFEFFLNSSGFLNLIRRIAGLPEITRCEAIATRYRQSHFTSFRTCPPPTIHAEAICVECHFGFTLEWAPEWGGALSFRDDDPRIVRAYVPSFNVLDMFAIPQGHWIGTVSPFASCDRLAIEARLYRPELNGA
jgi:hypothetical protein